MGIQPGYIRELPAGSGGVSAASALNRLFGKPHATVSAAEAAAMAGDVVVPPDVREPFGWEAGHIA